ncbi:MAG: hypothetical protein GY780_12315 [bacterium]|nr:hypothetical protein [bacterium]
MTASFMRSSSEADGWDNGLTQFDAGARHPIVGGRFEASFNGGFMVFDSSSFGVLLGAGLKVELLEDILAFELPAQFVLGGTNPVDTTFIYPRLIGSIPFSDKVELNLSTTRYYYAHGDFDGPAGYAAGLAFGKRGEMIIRPEFGVLIYPNSDDPTYQVGIAITPKIKKVQASTDSKSETESTPY